MKKIISKQDIRRQLEQQVDDYLDGGGEVTQVQRGISGRDNPTEALKPGSFSEGKTERTYLTDVVATLDARKKPSKAKATKRSKQPRKKLIYDDFGEPLRWEWVED